MCGSYGLCPDLGPEVSLLPDKGTGGSRWGPAALVWLLIAAATLRPGADAGAAGFWCLACGDVGVADAAANVVLFAPLGWALWYAGVPLRPGLAATFATTLAIELAQALVIPGRVGSASDVIANTAGGALGFLLPGLVHWLRASPARAARGAAAYAVFLGVAIAAGVALQAIPRPSALRWQRESPRLPGYTDFTGVVHAVRIDDTLARAGAVVPLRAREESTVIAVQVESGVADPRRAEIVSAMRSGRSAWAWIDQEGRDLRAYVASGSDRLRLRGHGPRLRNVMPGRAGERLALRLSGARYAYTFAITRGDTNIVRRTVISPADGWRLFMPFMSAREWLAPPLSVLWMAALLAPLGYGAVRSSARTVAGVSAGTAAYLIVLPLLLGCGPVPLAGWLGSAAGLAGGGWMGRPQ
jgi:hypothetical protein